LAHLVAACASDAYDDRDGPQPLEERVADQAVLPELCRRVGAGQVQRV